MSPENKSISEDKSIPVRFEGDIQMSGVVSEEDLTVGKRFQAGHPNDVGREGMASEYEITDVRKEKGEVIAKVRSLITTRW